MDAGGRFWLGESDREHAGSQHTRPQVNHAPAPARASDAVAADADATWASLSRVSASISQSAAQQQAAMQADRAKVLRLRPIPEDCTRDRTQGVRENEP